MWFRQRCVTSLSLSLLLGLASPLSAEEFQLLYDDGLLSVRADNTPLNELITALAIETGILFSTTGDSAPLVSYDIDQEPLVTAIGKLAPNHMLVRNSSAPDAAIIEVVLILDESGPDGDSGINEFLPSGAPSDEIIVGDSLPDAEGEPMIPTGEPATEVITDQLPSDDSQQEQVIPDDGSSGQSG